MKIQALTEALEAWAPVSLAESWDATGLQVGDPERECEAVLLCLDVSEAVLEEAIQDGANLILSHHPMLFTPLKSLDIRSKTGKLIKKCLSSELTVYSMHTNLDKAEGGMNDYAAGLLGLRDVSVLESSPSSDNYFKLVTFVPKDYRESLLQALFGVGGGRIGGYKECSFTCAGEGTFLPGEETSPVVGEKGTLNHVSEDRVEVLFSSDTLQRGIAALKSAHPYELPAFDVYPLVSTRPNQGYVRVGTLTPPSSWDAFLEKVQGAFNLSDFRVIGDKVETISRVTLCTGTGSNGHRCRAFCYGEDFCRSHGHMV